MYYLTATAWYYPSPATGPVPCRWEGWVDYGPAVGRQWVVVTLFGG